MITLSHGDSTITLRDPDFENVERFELSRINGRTRGGDRIIFRDPAWPKARIMDMKFSFLSEDQTQAFLRFLDDSLGQVITFVDHEGRSHTGIITTPTGEVVQTGRENKTAKFIFQETL